MWRNVMLSVLLASASTLALAQQQPLQPPEISAIVQEWTGLQIAIGHLEKALSAQLNTSLADKAALAATESHLKWVLDNWVPGPTTAAK